MSDTVPWTYRRAWPAHVRHVRDARQFVAGRLERDGLLDHRHGVLLAVSELATNAVLHARSGFTVTLGRVDDTLTLSVGDGSAQRLPDPAKERSGPGGWGLHLVGSVSNDWGVSVDDAGKSVWVVFDLTTPAASG